MHDRNTRHFGQYFALSLLVVKAATGPYAIVSSSSALHAKCHDNRAGYFDDDAQMRAMRDAAPMTCRHGELGPMPEAEIFFRDIDACRRRRDIGSSQREPLFSARIRLRRQIRRHFEDY